MRVRPARVRCSSSGEPTGIHRRQPRANLCSVPHGGARVHAFCPRVGTEAQPPNFRDRYSYRTSVQVGRFRSSQRKPHRPSTEVELGQSSPAARERCRVLSVLDTSLSSPLPVTEFCFRYLGTQGTIPEHRSLPGYLKPHLGLYSDSVVSPLSPLSGQRAGLLVLTEVRTPP